ncbi:hypothetical protein [Brevibacillus laterosporus]|uniref:hypothetical protein n=1 Tax=Brevibacillus laterosporus TaxID=1465 RepID=UPI000E6BBC06|nr:hypothetical protein [Brevibacillus laterosporus]AYB39905.1 hypothetical protein D5F52_17460 [Brevibacillus laterosporus]MBM7110552.1 hypothetical protein [Brevibacillus laterosporus]NKQ22340.1 hypothetical protein [Brevibacillus laterosporus]WNX31807.1 hypothetical protein RWW94_03010 [Brevibacillus laterosporus]
MQTIGQKIYFDKVTGNILVDTGELAGAVRETTLEEDFQTYVVLSERVKTSIGCIQLEYGQFTDNFSKGYAYHINAETNEIVWNLTPPKLRNKNAKRHCKRKWSLLKKKVSILGNK